MKNIYKYLTLLLVLPISIYADNNEGQSHRPDAHAPIGVMRDHVHKEGEVMLSYRFMYMFMDDNRSGSSTVSDAAVLNDYMVAPTDMTMKMHMLGVMYGLSDQLTISAMSGYLDNEMDHVRRDGFTFIQESEDITDTSVNLMYEFYNSGNHRVQFNAGVSLPTGSIDEPNPMNNGRLAYAMTTGSGTYDLLPGISYSGFSESWSWGAQLNGVIRLGDNDHDYTFGDRIEFTNWLAKTLSDSLSVSMRLSYQSWGNIDGQDPAFSAPYMAPPMDSNLYDGQMLEGFAGMNYLFTEGFFEDHRFAVEFGMPLYQDLDGPRLDEDYRLIIGWQKAFG